MNEYDGGDWPGETFGFAPPSPTVVPPTYDMRRDHEMWIDGVRVGFPVGLILGFAAGMLLTAAVVILL